MTNLTAFDAVVERHQAALGEIIGGSAEGFKALYSRGDDVTLANPFGPPGRGWSRVSETLDGAAAHYEGGELGSFEMVAKCVTADLAYTVEMERFTARLVGMDEARPVALRCTT